MTQEFSGLKNFSTLSPMPGFLDWLRGRDKDMLQLLESSQIETIKTLGLDEDIGKKFVSYLTNENLFVESKVYEIQEQLHLPGLVRECKEIIEDFIYLFKKSLTCYIDRSALFYKLRILLFFRAFFLICGCGGIGRRARFRSLFS